MGRGRGLVVLWKNLELVSLLGYSSNHVNLSVDNQSVLECASYRERLAKLLARKDDYWRQQAKSFWMADCDMNTKCFHSVTSSRK
ncbi:hypothetical protein POTOM_024849 [Populus tomentosa]|uniref:Uncharacterized protein n=1 Tax=Populus tomentosa TaxID=118781 RepID=A0A8X7ZH30_POPTO|nr:hypothetical protein POTOM_024849 [Populus tomentosa]